MYKLPSDKFRFQRIILGNLPMLDVSYQGSKRDQEYKEKFSYKEKMKEIMKTALHYGINFFAASSSRFNELAQKHLEAIQEIKDEEEVDIKLITCLGIPLEVGGKRINDYRRWKTHLTYESIEFGKEVKNKVFQDPILNCRTMWREFLNVAKPYEAKEMDGELEVNWNLWEKTVEEFHDSGVAWIEPGSEIDFLAIFRMDLLEELLDRTYEYGYRALLGSHHLGATVPLIEERRVRRFDGYVTPINKLGIMMFPTQREARDAVVKARKADRLVVGVKPFAGGRIRPEEALNYVFNRVKVDSCMTGVGTIEELKEDFLVAKNILGSKTTIQY